jgi:hypothetical protein
VNIDLHDCTFVGPALPEPFVRFELAELLVRHDLLRGSSGAAFERGWSVMRAQLRALGGSGGPLRVHNHVVAPLATPLGFAAPGRQEEVATRTGLEDGGWLMQGPDESRLRCWSVGIGTDLDAPGRGGRAYRFSPTRTAQRVLRACGEIVGLLTNGEEIRVLLCDPSRADSHINVPLTGRVGWREQAMVPDSYRLLMTLAAPRGLRIVPELLDAARLSQARVTKDLRVQARRAVEGFLQSILDHPANADVLGTRADLAGQLWKEALILVYRVLFIFKLESSTGAGGAFSFAATALWRNMLSPGRALAPLIRRHLDQGHDTGRMLEDGLRTLFRVFAEGLFCSELSIPPLGGALFHAASTPLLDGLTFGEHAVALLLDRLMWTTTRGGERARVQYGPLNVEDLGHVYEALLELEPGISRVPMVRLRRGRLEVVVPARYRQVSDETSIAAVEAIPPGRFYLRAGLGRKATGSYYTPHVFVRHLVQETLAPAVQKCSPDDNPNPAAILALKVVDPAMGSGHFLVEACRWLGEVLYAACRLCDERPDWRPRLDCLPDPDRTLLSYLPSRSHEGNDSGFSCERALAICRRLVAVHCLYGVDQNPLAVELAKLALWLESYADGLPLTFLDHRLVAGDSLGGAFFAQLAALPISGTELDPLLAGDVSARLRAALAAAMTEVQALECGVGRDTAELALKESAKARMDAALGPLRQLARAWSGAVMLGTREADDEWLALARCVADTGNWPATLTARQSLLITTEQLALPWDLTFPEVFVPDKDGNAGGFDAVLSNPPWDIVQQNAKEFLAGFDLSILDAPTKREASIIQGRLLADRSVAVQFRQYQQAFEQQHRLVARLYAHQSVVVDGEPTGGKLDAFRVFAERNVQLAGGEGAIGMVVPSSFHANEGATGVRRLYLQGTRLESCLSFENRRRLFDIHVRVKFALVVARCPGPTKQVQVGFYLDDFSQLCDPARIMHYDLAFIRASGGEHLTFLELRSTAEFAIASRIFLRHPPLRQWIRSRGIVLGREVNITDDAHRVVPVGRTRARPDEFLLLHEGKTIQQFDDRWDSGPRYAVPLTALDDKPVWRESARFFRLALRRIARSTDERTAIAAFTSPGYLFDITAQCERSPQSRPNAAALQLCAIVNSHIFDWILRQKTAVTVNLFILESCPICDIPEPAAGFLAHGALRMSCNHAAYAPLWQEQLGRTWREATAAFTWPAVPGASERQALRAAIDAVVADAYGLAHPEYQRILDSFNNRQAAAASLRAFEELTQNGIAAFMRGNDPYFGISPPSAVAMPASVPGEAIRLRRAS